MKLFVFSADAMVSEDLKLLKTLPNYRKYLSEASAVEKVRSIYPSITYPCHVTMSTGTYPDRHGVTSNFDFSPAVDPMKWCWFHDCVKAKDIFTAAKEKGLSTCSVFWPTTGRHPDIDYLIPEYWTQTKKESLEDAFAGAGSSPEILEVIRRHKDVMAERTHPMCDQFVIDCSVDILKKYRPDLMMIHPANIDAYRHQYGVFNDKVDQGIRETDAWIGQIFEAAEEADILEDFNFVLTSDHGQIQIVRTINLNRLLLDKGYIKTDADNNLVDWEAFCLGVGTSAHVYLKNRSDKCLYHEVQDLLLSLKESNLYGISEVFDAARAKKDYHLEGDFSFVLETDGYSSFGSSWKLPLSSSSTGGDYRYGKATHGHLPEKGPQPILTAVGPGFKNNVSIRNAGLVDEAPTYAKLLGLSLPDTDGRPIQRILR